MKKIQYRIQKRNNSYYPHVRFKSFWIWSSWEKISKTVHGYDLYSLPSNKYPTTKPVCVKIIEGYDKWYKEQNNIKNSYIDIRLPNCSKHHCVRKDCDGIDHLILNLSFTNCSKLDCIRKNCDGSDHLILKLEWPDMIENKSS